MNLDRSYPSVHALMKGAKKRIPHFSWEYLDGGIGQDRGKEHNRTRLEAIRLIAKYLCHDGKELDTKTQILGQEFAAPFGVAPIGLGGLMWPKVAEYLAEAAKERNLPFCMSTFATAKPEDIAARAGKNAWFQLYRPNDPEVREHVISRVEKAGFETLILTVDIPVMTRREREIAVGLSLPPQMTLANLLQMMVRPRWCLETLLHETPKFHVLDQYVPENIGRQGAAYYVSELIQGHQNDDALKELRDRWKGHLLIKGLQAPEDVAKCQNLGFDGVVVSNHGGRQLESAPSAVDVLPLLRAEFPNLLLIADSGVRSGAEIVKMLALGADFVMLGRAMMSGVCAAGKPGAGHVMDILLQEFRGTMEQLGLSSLQQIPSAIDKRI